MCDGPITLTISDLRGSVWNEVLLASRKQDDKQFDLHFPALPIPFADLTREIRTKFGKNKKGNGKIKICTPDRIRIDEDNCEKLKNGDTLVLLDSVDQEFPFVYKAIVDTTPHVHSVTKQEGAYYGTDEHNAAGFALAELVDNSLAATVNTGDPREICIRFYDNAENSSIHVLDNGHGMTMESLKSGLRYKAPKEGRYDPDVNLHDNLSMLPPPDPELDVLEERHPYFLNSKISKFGAGMKQSVFWLGEESRIMTKPKGPWDNVHEVHYSSAAMEAKEVTQGENAFYMNCCTGKPGQVRDSSASEQVRKLIEKDEPGKPNFTHLSIEKIHYTKNDKGCPLELLRVLDSPDYPTPSIEKQLAHIYHYYIHKRENREPLVKITVERYDSKGCQVSLCDLAKHVVEDLETQIVKTATDSFKFTAKVRCSKFDAVNTDAKEFKVGGVIRYHPYLYDQETNPLIRLRNGSAGSASGSDNQGIEGQSSGTSSEARVSTKVIPELFHVWWNGRLIPLTKLDSLKWCSASKTEDEVKFSRLSGSLFFDYNVTQITTNKLNAVSKSQLVEMLTQGKMDTTFDVTLHRIDQTSNSSRMDFNKNFQKWVKECSYKHDREVVYSDLIDQSPVKFDNKSCWKFKKATWKNVTLEVDNVVKLVDEKKQQNLSTSIRLRRVKHFLVPLREGQTPVANGNTTAPLGWFKAQRLPAALYTYDPESEPTERMSCIDTTVINVEELLGKQEEDLKLAIKVISMQHYPGLTRALERREDVEEFEGEIPIDSTLFTRIHLDVVQKSNKTSLHGCLPLMTKKDQKSISIVARVHRIGTDGTWELYYTSEYSTYCTYKNEKTTNGYHFKMLDLGRKMMDINDPGKYIITFRAYVDCKDKKKNTENASTSSKKTAPAKSTKSNNNQASSLPGPSRSKRGRPQKVALSVPSSSTASTANTRVFSVSSVPDPPYAEEWKLPVDQIGRKILVDGERQFRLPHYSFKFTVVPGVAQDFRIRDVGGDDGPNVAIGQPFTLRLEFSDGKGNVTKAPEVQSLSPIELKLRKGKPEDEVNLEIMTGHALAIPGGISLQATARGYLKGKNAMELRVEATVTVADKPLTFQFRTAFSPGLPNRLEILQDSTNIEVENGTAARIGCCVLDCSGNRIFRVGNGNSGEVMPILLKCDFYSPGKSGKPCLSMKLPAWSPAVELPFTDEIFRCEEMQANPQGRKTFQGKISFGSCEPVSISVTVVPSTRVEKIALYEVIRDPSKNSTSAACEPELEPESVHSNPLRRSTRQTVNRDESMPTTSERTRRSLSSTVHANNPAASITITNDDRLELIDGSVEKKVGESFLISYKLFDGLGRSVPFDPNLHKWELGWRQDLNKRKPEKLPVEYTCSKKTRSRTFTTKLILIGCDKSISHSFVLKTLPLEPNSLSLRIGTVPANIIDFPIDQEAVILSVLVKDIHDNVIAGLTESDLQSVALEPNDIVGFEPQLSKVETQDPDLADEDEKVSFYIKLTMQPPLPPLGENEFKVYLPGMEATFRLNFVAGAPVGLGLEINGQLEPPKRRNYMHVENMQTISVRVCLVDSQFNKARPIESMQVRLELVNPEHWHFAALEKAKPMVSLKPTSLHHMADLGQVLVGALPTVSPEQCKVLGTNRCDQVCFQIRKIRVSTDGKNWIYCGFHIDARANTPRRLEIHNNTIPFQAVAGGDSFEDLSVVLKAENGSNFVGAQVCDLRMELMLLTSEDAQSIVPSTSRHQPQPQPVDLAPSAVHNGVYSFSGVPTKAGIYKTRFVYSDSNVKPEVFEDLKIVSDKVVRLEPDPVPTQECISVVMRGEEGAANSVLITDALKLYLKDQHGNRVNAASRRACARPCIDIVGKVKIDLINETGDTNTLPTLQNEADVVRKHELMDGVVDIPALVIQRNPDRGISGTFKFIFTARLQDKSELTFELRFRVFDEVRQHKEVQDLENKKQCLTEELNSIVKELHTMSTAKIMHEKKLADLHRRENEIRNAITALLPHNERISIDQLTNVETIRGLMKSLDDTKKTLEQMRSELNRLSQQPQAIDDQGVIGVVGSLAQIASEGRGKQEDHKLVHTISWYLQGRLDINVVLKRDDGHRLNNLYSGQRFQILEILRESNLNWNQQVDQRLQRFGRPIYLRSLLRFPNLNDIEEAQARKCFAVFLGNTILVDDLRSATDLMHAINNGSFPYSCPPILTRDGNRLNNDAVLGGTGSSAPQQLRFKLLLAENPDVDRIERGKKELLSLSDFVSKREQCQTNLDNLMTTYNEDIRQLEAEKKTREDQLSLINQELKEKQGLFAGNQQQGRTSSSTRRIGSRLSAGTTGAPSPAKKSRR